jgi:hypothetical protein
VRFSEPVDAARFTEATARIFAAGADGEFGTADDAVVAASREFRNDGQLLQLSAATLPPGRYRLALREAEVFDASGNALGTSERLTTFTIVTRPRVADLFDLRGTEIATNTDFTLDGGEIRLGFGPNGSFIGNNRDVGIEFGGVEFVEPDTPLAAFTISYNGLNRTNSRSDGTQFSVTREDISTDSFKGIRIVATINTTIRMERVVGFNVGEQFITIATRLTNISAVTVEDAAILENMDPDQGKSLGLGNRSLNDLSDDQRLVTAGVSNASYPEALTLGLGSFDSRSRATAEGFAISDPRVVLDSPNDPNDTAEDLGIACAIRLGTLAAGESAFGSMLIVLGRSKADAIATFERFGPLTADAPAS